MVGSITLNGLSNGHPTADTFGPWRIWFDPPPIGTRNCDWHYQHEDAEPECPSWMYGHCASRNECIEEIIDGYEDRASDGASSRPTGQLREANND